MRGTLDRLRAQGFDESYHVPFTKQYKVRCSQCEAVCINGMATHETGCSNQRFECKGCNQVIDYRGYCEECR